MASGDSRLSLRRRDVLVAAGSAAVGGIGGYTAATSVERDQPVHRYIVGIDGPSREEVTRRMAEEVFRVIELGAIGEVVVGQFTDEVVTSLRDRGEVRYVEREIIMSAPKPRRKRKRTRGKKQQTPWGADRVDAETVRRAGNTGGGTDVAVVDTGVDSDHPDLRRNLGTGRAVVTCNREGCAQPWDDDNGHGTHVAGVVGAVHNNIGIVGVSPGTTIHPVKVLDDAGEGWASHVASGIAWAADRNHDVVTLSLGSPVPSQAVADACKYAYRNGVFLVAAAGNDGPCTGCVGYPAAFPEVVAVGATTRSDAISTFSSTGAEVELTAPGSEIPSTYSDGHYRTLSGTSMATPHVAGAAALLMADGTPNAANRSSRASPGGARGRLRTTAQSLSGVSAQDQGYGLLDVERAVLGTRNGDNLRR